jgi:hypothetical protein
MCHQKPRGRRAGANGLTGGLTGGLPMPAAGRLNGSTVAELCGPTPSWLDGHGRSDAATAPGLEKGVRLSLVHPLFHTKFD